MSRSYTIGFTAQTISAGPPLTNDRNLLCDRDKLLSTSKRLNRFQRQKYFTNTSKARAKDLRIALNKRSLAYEIVVKIQANLINMCIPTKALEDIQNLIQPGPIYRFMMWKKIFLQACLQYCKQIIIVSSSTIWGNSYHRFIFTFQME